MFNCQGERPLVYSTATRTENGSILMGFPWRKPLAVSTLVAACALLLALPPSALADTTFGPNLSQVIYSSAGRGPGPNFATTINAYNSALTAPASGKLTSVTVKYAGGPQKVTIWVMHPDPAVSKTTWTWVAAAVTPTLQAPSTTTTTYPVPSCPQIYAGDTLGIENGSSGSTLEFMGAGTDGWYNFPTTITPASAGVMGIFDQQDHTVLIDGTISSACGSPGPGPTPGPTPNPTPGPKPQPTGPRTITVVLGGPGSSRIVVIQFTPPLGYATIVASCDIPPDTPPSVVSCNGQSVGYGGPFQGAPHSIPGLGCSNIGCTASAMWAPSLAARPRPRPVVLVRASFTIRRGHSARIRFTLTAAGKRALAKRKSIPGYVIDTIHVGKAVVLYGQRVKFVAPRKTHKRPPQIGPRVGRDAQNPGTQNPGRALH
jgi:hypothetical protein